MMGLPVTLAQLPALPVQTVNAFHQRTVEKSAYHATLLLIVLFVKQDSGYQLVVVFNVRINARFVIL